MQHYIEKIFTAPVYDVATKTPLDAMPRLSDRIGHNVLCKREDLQPVFSFKLRGAYTKMYRLSAEERARGVICASAGNHAQGVALSANRLGMRAVIVMPVTTPQIKIDAVRRLGGAQVEIVLHGDFYDAASQHARELQEAHGYTYIHPFDDPDVIAGQGTIALEILTQHPHHIDAIFVPCGGGGLLAGIAVLAKSLRPDIKIIGVEPEDAASMTTAVRGGTRHQRNTARTRTKQQRDLRPTGLVCQLLHRSRCPLQRTLAAVMTHHRDAARGNARHIHKQTQRTVAGRQIALFRLLRKKTVRRRIQNSERGRKTAIGGKRYRDHLGSDFSRRTHLQRKFHKPHSNQLSCALINQTETGADKAR